MWIAMHNNATTTLATRLALQQASGTDRELTQQYGIGVDTVRKWRHKPLCMTPAIPALDRLLRRRGHSKCLYHRNQTASATIQSLWAGLRPCGCEVPAPNAR